MPSTIKTLVLISLLSLITACGGGGSLSRDDDSGGSGSSELSVSLELVDEQSGDASTELSAATPLVAQATVTDETGAAVEGETVTFSLPVSGRANLDPADGLAATNANGVASIRLVVGSTAGEANIVATVDGEEASTSFNSAGDGGQSTIQAASMEVYATSNQMASSGADSVEIIALLKDQGNRLLPGAEVVFSATSGELPAPGVAVSGEDGTARTTLTSKANPENRDITVTATSGTLTQDVVVSVLGTEIQIDGGTSVVLNNSTELFISLLDSDDKGIANQTVSLSAENGTLAESEVTTNTDGKATVVYTGTQAGLDTISAEALNASAEFEISVQRDNFRFVSLPSDNVPLGDNATVTIRWEKDGSAFAGGSVTFLTSRGQFSSSTVTTDANGEASVSISSNNAGTASISAEGEDSEGNKVSVTGEVNFIATDADSIIVDATPDSIGPDGQTSTITAVVRDPNDNLVEGMQVSFNVDDPSAGSLEPNSAVTNDKGVASTVFTSNAVTNEEFVTITATVVEDNSVTGQTNVTVGDRPFDISFGTGNLIESPSAATYRKEYAVFVTDPQGSLQDGVDLTASVVPEPYAEGGVYRKGYWVWSEPDERWLTVVTAVCDNEDINGNGILDAGEDTNGDGQLTPGILGSISFKDGENFTDSVVTNSSDPVLMYHTYAESFAPWTEVKISVESESAGSESEESHVLTLTVSGEDVSNEDAAPAPNSFGSSNSCADPN
ncbi:hypothetical protein HMF8227_01294 [Saliniradius amylolyticus]|uniref:Big-1 domain-containing protein n=1 Tax=Saliniradius amylolyticus TaxID=2183582 RepID=A0A2S2E2M6_9ALTE|nr:Ig-like domain-containing protein [Saliniradius amylolyticus]AWL11772.1 hypothetical protein HMF8227_01294 [Saliniradius amylolyticus]